MCLQCSDCPKNTGKTFFKKVQERMYSDFASTATMLSISFISYFFTTQNVAYKNQMFSNSNISYENV